MDTVWEKIYQKGELLTLEPHPEVSEIVDMFKKEKVKRILDLGSGGGRHVVYFARKGFDVYGLDLSPTALQHTLGVLGEKGLAAHLTFHDMVTLPYDNEYFDAVISVKVIHHNTLKNIRKTIKEVTRVLKYKGLLWATVPVSRYEPSTTQKEIESGTFIPLDGCEKGLPHHYFTKEEIKLILTEFSVVDLHIDPVNHYSVLARKNPSGCNKNYP